MPSFCGRIREVAAGEGGRIYRGTTVHLVRLTEVCGKVLSEKYANKSVKTAMLLSIFIDADHQNSCLFTNKGHFHYLYEVF